MPITVNYPGVYIEELPSGVHTITGVATSITAFIGRAARGQVNEPITITSFADYDRTFGGLWQPSSMSFAVNDFYGNGGSTAIIVRLTHQAGTATFTLPEDAEPQASPLHGAVSPPSTYASLNLQAASPGAWANNLGISVDYQTKDSTDLSLFNLTLTLMDAARQTKLVVEKYLNLSVDPASSRFIGTVLDQQSELAVVVTDMNGKYEVPYVRPALTVASGSPPQGPWFQGGDDGGPLTDTDFLGDQADKEGLYALEKADLFNILCIPPYLGDNSPHGDDVSTNLVSKAAQYCEDRRAFYILDPPSAWTSLKTAQTQFSQIQQFVGTTSDHAAIFFPRVLEQNPLLDNQLDTIAPSGAIAGVFARTDAQRGVWKAPAGQDATLNGVVQLALQLTDPENGLLNPLGLNCLRTFPLVGNVVWGARTIRGADALADQWKYIPVRRTALFLEESLYRGLKWAVFEPNDETLWQNIRLNAGSFMHDQFRKGAFQGSSPDQAYFVKCDSETTTQSDIDNGVVNVIVGFAPLKPAEFVVIQIQQMAGQLQV
jgi:phage tail sheath protein FI